ncbi:MAG: helix-turn-helix transcriptional regulator [Ferruginibacter sp.]
MNVKTIGEFIRKRRQILNLRQEDLSELSKLTTKTIHMIEQGNGNPSFATLEKLSEVLGFEIVLKIKQVN